MNASRARAAIGVGKNQGLKVDRVITIRTR